MEVGLDPTGERFPEARSLASSVLPTRLKSENTSSRQLVDTFQERLGWRNNQIGEVVIQSLLIELAPHGGMTEECLDFRRKDEATLSFAVIDRLDTDAVPGKQKSLPPVVPDAKCEVPVQALDHLHERGLPGNRIYYLAVPPSMFVPTVNSLQRARFVAPPGHSQHQLGTAIDFRSNDGRTPFATTRAGGWMKANAWKYGWLMSYPSGKAALTCYSYEPWHYRYVGRTVARLIHFSGLTVRQWIWRHFGS